MKYNDSLTDLLGHLQKEPNSLAFQIIFQKYRPMIITVIKKFNLTSHDTDDLFQEASLVCYQTACSFDPKKTATTYGAFFKLSLINHCRTLVRQENAQKREVQKHLTSLEGLLEVNGDTFSSKTKDPYELVQLHLLYEHLPQILSPLEYQVFCAKINCHNTDEVAQQLHLSRSQTYNALARCHQNITAWCQQ